MLDKSRTASAAGLNTGPLIQLVDLGPYGGIPQLAARLGGGFIVTYSSGDFGWFQVFSKNGGRLSPTIHMVLPVPINSTLAAVGMADGKSLIFFQSRDGLSIFAQPVTAEFALSPEGISYEMQASTVTPIFSDRLANGNAITVWEEQKNSPFYGISAISTKSNAYPPSFFGPNTIVTNYLNLLGVRALSRGGAIVSYWAQRPSDGAFGLHLQKINSTWMPEGKSRVLSAYGTVPTPQGVGVGALASGGFVCVWQQTAQGAGVLRGRFYSAGLNEIGNFSLSLADYVIDRPSVVEAANGSILTLNIGPIATDGIRYTVFATLFGAGGEHLAGPIALFKPERVLPASTSLIRLADGSFWAAWKIGQFGSSVSRLYGKRIFVS